MPKPLIPLPTCETCGKPVKKRWRKKGVPTRFCSNRCVPRLLRAVGGRKGRLNASDRRRLRVFREHVRRLQAAGTITGTMLLDAFAAIGRREYQRGYCACDAKWQWRMQKGA